MNLMIERAFIVALLLSISGFVFCAIFLPFEKIAYKWTSARTMVYVNTVALFSFVTPLYFVISLRDGSEKAFIQSDLLIHQDISGYDGFIYNVRDQIHMEYLGTIWLIGVIGFSFIMYGNMPACYMPLKSLCSMCRTIYGMKHSVRLKTVIRYQT